MRSASDCSCSSRGKGTTLEHSLPFGVSFVLVVDETSDGDGCDFPDTTLPEGDFRWVFFALWRGDRFGDNDSSDSDGDDCVDLSFPLGVDALLSVAANEFGVPDRSSAALGIRDGATSIVVAVS